MPHVREADIITIKKTLIWCFWLKGCIFYRTCSKMTIFAFVSVINHYHINGLHLFWDTHHIIYAYSTLVVIYLIIYIIIIIMSCRWQGYSWPSLATSPYRSSPGRSSGIHPVSSHSCCMYVRAGRPAFARSYVGVHRSTSLMSSSLLLQHCPACLVRLTWIVFVMGGRWPYSWCFVGCCRQDLFNIARNILV